MKRTAGRFTFDRREQKPIKIEISWDFLHHPKPNVIKDILFHELIHYLLCMLGKPFDDKDEVFQLELQKHGVPSVLDTGKRYEYVCEYGI